MIDRIEIPMPMALKRRNVTQSTCGISVAIKYGIKPKITASGFKRPARSVLPSV
jgi:hypothetical protein